MVTKLNLELILFILVLIPRAVSSLFSTLLVFILPYSFQLSGALLSSLFCWFFPFLFHTLFMHFLFLTALAWCFHSDSWQRSCCDKIKPWINSAHFGLDTSCSFFPLLFYSACLYSSQLFSISGALSSSLFCWFFPFLFPRRFMQLFF